MEGRMSRLSTAVVVVPGMEIGWLEGIEREGQGLDWIELHIGRISEIPLLRRIMIHTYLFFQTQKYNVTFVKL